MYYHKSTILNSIKSSGLHLAEEAVSEQLFGINAEIFKSDSLCLLLLIGKEIQVHTIFPTPPMQNPSTRTAFYNCNDAPHRVWAH